MLHVRRNCSFDISPLTRICIEFHDKQTITVLKDNLSYEKTTSDTNKHHTYTNATRNHHLK